MAKMDEYIALMVRKYGDQFDTTDLDPAFVPFFNSGERVRVKMWEPTGEEPGDDGTMTGTIGITTGWRPAFLLMQRSNSHGSPWTLTHGETVVAVQRGRKYVTTLEITTRVV